MSTSALQKPELKSIDLSALDIKILKEAFHCGDYKTSEYLFQQQRAAQANDTVWVDQDSVDGARQLPRIAPVENKKLTQLRETQSWIANDSNQITSLEPGSVQLSDDQTKRSVEFAKHLESLIKTRFEKTMGLGKHKATEPIDYEMAASLGKSLNSINSLIYRLQGPSKESEIAEKFAKNTDFEVNTKITMSVSDVNHLAIASRGFQHEMLTHKNTHPFPLEQAVYDNLISLGAQEEKRLNQILAQNKGSTQDVVVPFSPAQMAMTKQWINDRMSNCQHSCAKWTNEFPETRFEREMLEKDIERHNLTVPVFNKMNSFENNEFKPMKPIERSDLVPKTPVFDMMARFVSLFSKPDEATEAKKLKPGN